MSGSTFWKNRHKKRLLIYVCFRFYRLQTYFSGENICLNLRIKDTDIKVSASDMSKMEFDGIRHKLLPEIIPKQKTEPLLPIPSSFDASI